MCKPKISVSSRPLFLNPCTKKDDTMWNCEFRHYNGQPCLNTAQSNWFVYFVIVMITWASCMFGIHTWVEVRRNLLFQETDCYIYGVAVQRYRYCDDGGCVCKECNTGGNIFLESSCDSCDQKWREHKFEIDKYDMTTVSEIDGICGGDSACCRTKCETCCRTDDDGEKKCSECNCVCVDHVNQKLCEINCNIQYEAQVYLGVLWNPTSDPPDISRGLDPMHPTEVKYVTKVFDLWKTTHQSRSSWYEQVDDSEEISEWLSEKFPNVPFLDLDLDGLRTTTTNTTSMQEPTNINMTSSEKKVFGWQHIKNAAISGHNTQSVSGSVQVCKNACESYAWCNSFDYSKAGVSCDLSNAPISTSLKTNYVGDPYDHYRKLDPEKEARQTSMQEPTDMASSLSGRIEFDRTMAIALKNENPILRKCFYEPLTEILGAEHTDFVGEIDERYDHVSALHLAFEFEQIWTWWLWLLFFLPLCCISGACVIAFRKKHEFQVQPEVVEIESMDSYATSKTMRDGNSNRTYFDNGLKIPRDGTGNVLRDNSDEHRILVDPEMGFSYKVDITGKVIMPLQWDSNNADKPRWRTDLEEDAKGPEYIIPLDPRQKQEFRTSSRTGMLAPPLPTESLPQDVQDVQDVQSVDVEQQQQQISTKYISTSPSMLNGETKTSITTVCNKFLHSGKYGFGPHSGRWTQNREFSNKWTCCGGKKELSNQCCKNLELQWNCCASKEQSSTHCKYLSIKPGLNSFSEAVIVAKEQGIGCLLLECGVHDEKGESVEIDFALKVIGQNKDDVKIRAGLVIKGKKREDVFLSDCTVTGANADGITVWKGAAMHSKNVCVEKCESCGVSVYSTKRNTMTDCNVNNNKESGVVVFDGGCMIIDGSATTIHHNVTRGNSDSYGLYTDSSSSIHLKLLYKESISTNNGKQFPDLSVKTYIDDFILKGDGMTAWWDNMEEYGYYNGALGPELYDELHRAQVLPHMNFTEFVKMVQSTKLIYKKIRLIIKHIIEGHKIPASESEHKENAMVAVKKDWEALEFVSDELKNDIDVVTAAAIEIRKY